MVPASVLVRRPQKQAESRAPSAAPLRGFSLVPTEKTLGGKSVGSGVQAIESKVGEKEDGSYESFMESMRELGAM